MASQLKRRSGGRSLVINATEVLQAYSCTETTRDSDGSKTESVTNSALRIAGFSNESQNRTKDVAGII